MSYAIIISIGRFLQADSVVMPESLYGMNRYMYTFGNPIRFGDSGGNKTSQTAMFAMAMYFHKDTIAQSGVDPNHAFIAGMYALKGGKNPGRDIGNTAKWVFKGYDNAAKEFNDLTGQSYHSTKYDRYKVTELKKLGDFVKDSFVNMYHAQLNLLHDYINHNNVNLEEVFGISDSGIAVIEALQYLKQIEPVIETNPVGMLILLVGQLVFLNYAKPALERKEKLKSRREAILNIQCIYYYNYLIKDGYPSVRALYYIMDYYEYRKRNW